MDHCIAATALKFVKTNLHSQTMSEEKKALPWPVLPCAVGTCPEKQLRFVALCSAHCSSQFKTAHQCDKCAMYSVKTVEGAGRTYCHVCWDEISDREPKQWCAFRTTKKVCTRSAHEGCEGLCREHFQKFDKCIICGVFRNKELIPANIKNIDILGGKTCRRCVNRTRRMSALTLEMPPEFEVARTEAEEQQRDREEKHREAAEKKRAQEEEESSDEKEDPNELDNKHVDHEDERPISARTRGGRGNKRRRAAVENEELIDGDDD